MIKIHILNAEQCRSRSVGFWRRSQLIRFYTVGKGRAYPSSAKPGLKCVWQQGWLWYTLHRWAGWSKFMLDAHSSPPPPFKTVGHFIQIISLGDNLLEMSGPISRGNSDKFHQFSAEFATLWEFLHLLILMPADSGKDYKILLSLLFANFLGQFAPIAVKFDWNNTDHYHALKWQNVKIWCHCLYTLLCTLFERVILQYSVSQFSEQEIGGIFLSFFFPLKTRFDIAYQC